MVSTFYTKISHPSHLFDYFINCLFSLFCIIELQIPFFLYFGIWYSFDKFIQFNILITKSISYIRISVVFYIKAWNFYYVFLICYKYYIIIRIKRFDTSKYFMKF